MSFDGTPAKLNKFVAPEADPIVTGNDCPVLGANGSKCGAGVDQADLGLKLCCFRARTNESDFRVMNGHEKGARGDSCPLFSPHFGNSCTVCQANCIRCYSNTGMPGRRGPRKETLAPVAARSRKGGNQNSPEKDVHGNDHSTIKPAEGYSLRDRDTGAVLKYGETTLHTGRYTKAYLKKHNAVMVFEAKGSKKEMHTWQHERIMEYRAENFVRRPPLNQSDC
jgi:hypothetical protein